MILEPRAVAARSEEAWRMKRPNYAQWTECWRYSAPGIDPFFGGYGEYSSKAGYPSGSPRYDHLFDSTLAYAADKHANMLMHELFPDGREWGHLTDGIFTVEGEGASHLERQNAIEATQKRIFQAIHSSNFTLAGGSMTKDGVISGTGCMKVGLSKETRTSVIEFDATNQAHVAFERGPTEQIWGFYRKMEVKATHFPVLWPEGEGFPTPEKDDLESGKEKEWDVVEATWYDSEEQLWRYDVLLMAPETGEGPKRIFERTYIVSPWIAWRYWLAPGEVQGRSPVMAALPDARTVNKVVETRLRSANIRTPGIYTYRQDGFNPATAVFEAGALLPVFSNDHQNPSIKALEMAGDPQFGELIIEDLRMSIRRTMLDIGLPEPTGAVRSATEIIERLREVQQTLGQPFVRLIAEVGRPILRTVAYLLAEAGQLPELTSVSPAGPPNPLRLDGSDYDVQFTSPLSTSQELSDAQSVIRWAEACRSTAGDMAFESAVRTEEIPRVLAEKMSVDMELIRSEDERVQREMEAREAQLAQAAGPAGMEMGA